MASHITSSPTFTITITADTICAWCYIHHVRLRRALTLYSKTYNSQDTFSITYKPYILQPQLTSTSVPVSEKFHERFGPKRAGTISKMMDRIASADGIKFSPNGRVGDSRASHQVVAVSGRVGDEGAQMRVVGEIMRRYYEEDGDITDEDMLVDCAVNAGGIREDVARAALRDANLGRWVNEQARLAREQGIDGVPHMVINGTVVDGAKDVEDLFALLIEIKVKGQSANQQSPASKQCKDGVC